jgi:type IV pilus assembly protein PilQ
MKKMMSITEVAMNIKPLRSGKVILLFLFCVMVAFAGCAAQKPGVKAAHPEAKVQEAKKAGQEKVFLKMISVVGEGDAVLIEADGPVQYTAFRLTDPPRLIVDLPDVDVSLVESSMEIDNNFLTEIKAISYGDGDQQIARVEIGLRQGINHDVKSGEDSVLVNLEKDVYIPGESIYEEGVFFEETLAEEETIEEITPPGQEYLFPEAAAPTEEVEAVEEAKKLLNMDFSSDRDTTVVKIVADGAIGNYISFGLDDPPRFVIDIWGVGSSLARHNVSIGGPHIERVRVGLHPDKVRLVFDSSMAEVPNHLIDKKGDAMVLTFGSAAVSVPEGPRVVKEPEAIPSEPEELVLKEPLEEGGVFREEEETVQVEEVDFRKLRDSARLTVVTSAKPSYKVKESMDGKTITLDIKDALIPEKLKATLDASELGTPVATISSFQSSLKPEMDVRILVRLRDEAFYDVSGYGNTINIDFPLKRAVREKAAAMAAPEPAPLVDKAVNGNLYEQALAAKKYTGKRVVLNMVDVQITDILKFLAEEMRLNLVTSDDVKGTITLTLKNVPADQAFDLILKTKGLDKVQEGNIIRVAPATQLAKERQEFLAAKKAEEKLEDLQTEYVRISYDEAAALEAQVKKLLSDRGDVTSHEPTNTLIVKDIRSGIEEALEYLKRVDIPTPQVLIEARIVEAENSFARDLGIQWGVDIAGGGPKVTTNLFGSSEQLGSAVPDPAIQSAIIQATPVTNQVKTSFPGAAGVSNYAVNLPATGVAGPLGALGFILGKTGANPMILDLRISAGEQKGLVKTISRPRVITLDNKEAKIEQGESIPFETTSAAGTATTFIDANLSLTVKPQITPDGSVLMEIKASSNSIGSFRTSGGEPSINKKEAATEVLVRDGETTVIGGIVVSDINDTDSGIPFLKDIPGLGWFFKSKSFSDTQRELLIFITPSIVKENHEG